MPIFAAFVGGLLIKLSEILATIIVKRGALVLTALGVSAGLVVSLAAACATCIPTISALQIPLHTLTGSGIRTGLWLINAGALGVALACCVSIELAITSFKWAMWVYGQASRA
jgi:hypothetical protein